MTRMEETRALREDKEVHYNCAQSVLIPFRDVCGLDRETARKLASNLGSGLRHGGTCGTVAAAMLVLGLAGKGAPEAAEFVRRFREKHRETDCAALLSRAKEAGIPRKEHCDALVLEMAQILEEEFFAPGK